MKIKIFTAATAGDLEADVNKFISQKEVNIIKMDFSTAVTGNVHMAYSVMLSYEMHGFIEESEGFY
ncbi:MAG: hypothetical protein FWG70_09570 [Oscillospiraceae bacterium]|nr:hypothetical protein [Oscillospiraceae bacterium]